MLPTPSLSHDAHLHAHDAEGKTEGEAMQQAHDAEGLLERQGIGNDESSGAREMSGASEMRGASEMSGAKGHEWSSTWEEDRSWAASQPRAVARAAKAAAGGPSLYPAAGSWLQAPGPPPPPFPPPLPVPAALRVCDVLAVEQLLVRLHAGQETGARERERGAPAVPLAKQNAGTPPQSMLHSLERRVMLRTSMPGQGKTCEKRQGANHQRGERANDGRWGGLMVSDDGLR